MQCLLLIFSATSAPGLLINDHLSRLFAAEEDEKCENLANRLKKVRFLAFFSSN
jgi:hypothetical protein